MSISKLMKFEEMGSPDCNHGKKITSQKANKSQLSVDLRLDISICK